MFSNNKMCEYKFMFKKLPLEWAETYKINSLSVNPQGRLGLYGVLNLIQETAWKHAESLGFGLEDMQAEELYWVVTRQSLQMKTWLPFGRALQVQTWLRPPEGAFITREFLLFDEQGQEVGACSTSWLALHRATKKIVPVQSLRDWPQLTLQRGVNVQTEKIQVDGDFEKLAQFAVRNSDLDINQHVNNTKYSQWILDSIPYSWHQSLHLTAYSVNFLAETRLDDEVQIERGTNSPDPHSQDSGFTHYRGLRCSDQKTLFAATLHWEKK